MARVKGAMNARKKHKKVLKLAKGYRGSRSCIYSLYPKFSEVSFL